MFLVLFHIRVYSVLTLIYDVIRATHLKSLLIYIYIIYLLILLIYVFIYVR